MLFLSAVLNHITQYALLQSYYETHCTGYILGPTVSQWLVGQWLVGVKRPSVTEPSL